VDLAPFARLALDCVHRAYPYHLVHLMRSDADARPPRELTPAFYGCFDWHSAVHGHWLLARFARLAPDHAFATEARSALETSFTAERIAGEVVYMSSRPAFERPYGLAWLLTLHAELAGWDDTGGVGAEGAGGPRTTTSDARRWAGALAPLAQLASGRFREWLPKLRYPARSGAHSQTAFSLGLVLDWARATGDGETAALVEATARAHHGDDRDLPIHLEPSGEDFLSPSLGAADLMARVMDATELAAFLDRALPAIPRDGRGDWLEPAVVTDPTDGRIAHLDGLNLSRAWMLRRVAAALPQGDARVAALRAAAELHRARGLASVTGEHYAGAHWLGTFATYLETTAVRARDS